MNPLVLINHEPVLKADNSIQGLGDVHVSTALERYKMQ